MGGNFLLRINTAPRPIVNKYREGKVKRTLERELEVRETARGEANETSVGAVVAAELRKCSKRRRYRVLRVVCGTPRCSAVLNVSVVCRRVLVALLLPVRCCD